LDYINLLKNNDLKVTPQRLIIVKELDTKGHMSIDDLYIALHSAFPSISLATIYKNINVMINKLFIQEVKIPNEKSVYELAKEEHAHALCVKCNAIMDMNLDVSKFIRKAETLSNYSLSKSSVIFSGICPTCQMS